MRNIRSGISAERFRGIYIIAACVMAFGVWMLIPLNTRAANEPVTISNASASSSGVTVSGTTNASSVMVQIRNDNGDILDMYSMGVLNGEFSGTVNVSLTSGQNVNVYVADYEGGAFAIQSTTVSAASQNPSGGSGQSGNTSSGTSDQNGSESNDGGSSSGSSVTKKVTSVRNEYTVVKNDTMTKIARKLGVSLSVLCKWNPDIKNINLIFPGQKIIYYTEQEVSADTSGNASDANNTDQTNGRKYYVVVKGDNMSKIARKFGMPLRKLLELNPLKNPNLIHPGQRIYYN